MSSEGPRREVAFRLFAEEFNDATHTYAESDEERAPKYLVTPTGARVNRLFVVGVLTEVEEVSDDVVRARVVDPTGAFVIYAGQYQPDSLAFFERADPPAFVAVTGKARTFQPDGSDRVFTSIRPESVNEVDADTRDRWVVQTAEHTLERVAVFAKALETGSTGDALKQALRDAGVQPGLAAGIPKAIEAYGTTAAYLASIQDMAVDATRLVAGETDAVERKEIAPDEGGDADVDTSFAADISLEAEPAGLEPGEEADVTAEATQEITDEPDAEPETGAAEAEPVEEPETETETETEAETEAETETVDVEAEAEADAAEVEPAEPDVETESPEEETEVGIEDTGIPGTEESEAAAEAPDVDVEETDEMYELSEEERAEVRENYDVDFESGAEIGSPDEDTTGPGEEAEEAEAGETEEVTTEAAAGPEAEDVDTEETAEADTEVAEETDAAAEADLGPAELEDAVIETMKAEGGADGIERAALVEAVQAEYGADEDAIEDAIQEALLGGRCFESGDDRLKPI